MATKTPLKTPTNIVKVPRNALRLILDELRLLRKEVAFLFPQEDLEDYANPARIKRSYQKAIRKYPPVSLWK